MVNTTFTLKYHTFTVSSAAKREMTLKNFGTLIPNWPATLATLATTAELAAYNATCNQLINEFDLFTQATVDIGMIQCLLEKLPASPLEKLSNVHKDLVPANML